MSDSTFSASTRALTVLRLGVATVLGVHPLFRMIERTIPGFGAYLSSVGFPLGVAVAWAITLGEVAGVACLASGRYVRLAVVYHVFILLTGIVMVHGREGWFVVGGGRNGVEFSVLLIVVLVTLWLAEPARERVADI